MRIAVLFCLLAVGVAAASPNASKIARGASAGPASIAAHASFIDVDDATGKVTMLQKGSNEWTCFVGHPGVIGDDPFCTDRAGMQWTMDWMGHKPKPTNTKPGIMYMFAGGRDWSAGDPWATKGTPISEPAHWMILWPFDAKASGLPASVKMTGTWIMWAGTPYAHLMINQKP